MKVSMNIRKVFVPVLVVLTCGFASASTIANEHSWNDQVKDGLLLCRKVYIENPEGVKVPVHKMEFSYDENGQINEKRIYLWNPRTGLWQKESLTSITRKGLHSTIVITKWAKTGRKIDSEEKVVYTLNDRNENIPLTAYQKCKNTGDWIEREMQLLTYKNK